MAREKSARKESTIEETSLSDDRLDEIDVKYFEPVDKGRFDLNFLKELNGELGRIIGRIQNLEYLESWRKLLDDKINESKDDKVTDYLVAIRMKIEVRIAGIEKRKKAA